MPLVAATASLVRPLHMRSASPTASEQRGTSRPGCSLAEATMAKTTRPHLLRFRNPFCSMLKALLARQRSVHSLRSVKGRYQLLEYNPQLSCGIIKAAGA